MGSKAILCSLLWAVTALAQTDKLASVAGVVVNSITGAPLPRVHVALVLNVGEDRTYGAMTAADGKFSIDGMEPGPYSLAMERIGFSMLPDADAPESILLLLPGERKDDLRLKMDPAGAITGRVTNAEGEPVQGAEVEAAINAGATSDVTVTTDAAGHFRIGGLTPGRYRVRAIPENLFRPPESRSGGTVDVQDAPTWYPRSLTFRGGERVDVSPGGETSGVEIRLERVPIVAVGGKVEDVPANGFNAQLFLTQPDGRGRGTPGIKPDGTFRLWRLFPGKYEIRATWQVPGGRQFQTVPVDFEVAGSSVENLRLRMIPPADIAGHTEFQDDAAKPKPESEAKLTLVNVSMQGGAVSSDIAADGSFRVTQVPAGRYRVMLSWGKVYVASMQLGLAAIDGSLLDLTNGDPGGQLSVRVNSATGSLSGTVTADNSEKSPAAGARVVLVFDGEGGSEYPLFAKVDSGGKYSFEGVPPDRYKLIAVQDMGGSAIEEFGDPLETIEIHQGEKTSRDLTLRLTRDR